MCESHKHTHTHAHIQKHMHMHQIPTQMLLCFLLTFSWCASLMPTLRKTVVIDISGLLAKIHFIMYKKYQITMLCTHSRLLAGTSKNPQGRCLTYSSIYYFAFDACSLLQVVAMMAPLTSSAAPRDICPFGPSCP